MVNRSRGTLPGAPGAPVRFYKFVAVTFLLLTLALLGLIAFMSAKRADIIITTHSDSVDATFPLEIGPGVPQAAVKASVTTTVITLSKAMTPSGLRTATTTNSDVKITLVNESVVAQPLVATTRVQAADGTLMRLRRGVTVPAQGNIEADVYLDQAGSVSTVPAARYTIPGLSSLRQQQVYAQSAGELNFTGVRKVGVITADDITKGKAELLEAMKVKAQQGVTAVTGTTVLATVLQQIIETPANIGDETESFTLNGRATLALVSYEDKDLLAQANQMLAKQIVDASEILESANATPSVSLENYELTSGVATLKVVHSGLVNIDPNSPELQKVMFFGKTEDEVRRYLLSLDHVKSVEIKFKPLWNHTVPHVADHVDVTVVQAK